MKTNAVAALEIADGEFVVASLIERCPKLMMVRELVMNALEAARLAPEGQRQVEISPVDIDGVAKLCIWNTGPGMDAGELLRICNIASSIGKEKSLSPKVSPQGATNVSAGAGPASDAARGSSSGEGGDSPREKPSDLSVLPSGAKRAELFKNIERAPEIIPLFSDAEIEEKGIKGRAGRYVMEASQLFVNMQYSAIAEMRVQLEAEYVDATDLDLMRSLAKQHAEKTMVLRVGRTVVYALAKQLNKEWDQKALETAASPESLSMAADDFHDAMQNVRRAIGKALRITRTDADPSSEAA